MGSSRKKLNYCPFFLLLITFTFSHTSCCRAENPTIAIDPVGFLIECYGSAEMQLINTSKLIKVRNFSANSIKPINHFQVVVYPGQIFRCKDKGFIRLQLYGRQVVITQSNSPYIVPKLQPKRWNNVDIVLEQTFTRAGRNRGLSVLTFSPPIQNGSIKADTFVIHWIPQKVNLDFEIINAASMDTIWFRSQIAPDSEAGSKGELSDPQMTKTLRALCEDDKSTRLIMRIFEPDKDPIEVRFNLLSASQVAVLHQNLGLWNRSKSALIRLIGQANTYRTYGLYFEAATAYEKALSLFPDDIELLKVTIAAETTTGNKIAAELLTQHLTSLHNGVPSSIIPATSRY